MTTSSTAAFDLDLGPATLRRTPPMLDAWLRTMPSTLLECDEGDGTWSPLVVLGHLIEGERHDWIPRVRHLLEHGEAVPFAPFDRFSQLRAPARSVAHLLDEFAACRAASLDALSALRLSAADLDRRGRHPEFGAVTLGQHLATWVAHDFDHVVQIARTMANTLRGPVGPWRAYLRVIRDAAAVADQRGVNNTAQTSTPSAQR
ncbi:MAG: DinB family protein [Planctomycetes bacterium]|nr:DinB family protein [Planctomycetota bacterium]